MAASSDTSSASASLDADQVEAECMSGIRVGANVGLLDERISGEFEDDPPSASEPRWERPGAALDHATGRVMDELKRRAALPGGSYPFQLVSNSLEYAPSKTLAYEFCLAVSRAATLTEGEHVRLPRNFERLSAIVARLYLGSGAEAVRIGWPSDNEDPAPHPKTFIDRIALLRARSTPGSGEWELEPEEGFESSADNAKDHGMDFVAWKSFPDQRIGRLTIIGQCACGKNDQGDDRKAQELNFDSVKLLLRRLTWPNPIRAFASPFHVPEPERFKALHALPNLVFDRARIAAVCEGEPNDSVLAEMRPRLAELISLAVERFKLAKPRRRGKRSRQ